MTDNHEAHSRETNAATANVNGGTVSRGSHIVTPVGIGLIVGIAYVDIFGQPVAKPINAMVEGKSIMFALHDVRKAKLTDYMFSRTGFGRTSWPEFAVIQAFCLALIGTGIVTWSDSGWVAAAFAAAIEGVLVYGTWGNFTSRIR